MEIGDPTRAVRELDRASQLGERVENPGQQHVIRTEVLAGRTRWHALQKDWGAALEASERHVAALEGGPPLADSVRLGATVHQLAMHFEVDPDARATVLDELTRMEAEPALGATWQRYLRRQRTRLSSGTPANSAIATRPIARLERSWR